MSTLSKTQKRDVCMLAKKAWDRWAREDWVGGLNADVSEAALFRAWRTREQQAAVGQLSLTTCYNHEFPALMAHFARLAGDEKLEAYWTGRMLEDGRGRVLYILKTNCQQRGLAYPQYPEGICRAQNKCGLGGATELQLWRLVYTVRNRRKKKCGVRNAECGVKKNGGAK